MNFLYCSEAFRQLSSTFVDILCGKETFRQHFVPPKDLPSKSVNFPGISETFCPLLMLLGDLLSNSIKLQCSRETFRQHL